MIRRVRYDFNGERMKHLHWWLFVGWQAVAVVMLSFANIPSSPLLFIAGMLLLLPGDLIWLTGWLDKLNVSGPILTAAMFCLAVLLNGALWFAGRQLLLKAISRGYRRVQ